MLFSQLPAEEPMRSPHFDLPNFFSILFSVRISITLGNVKLELKYASQGKTNAFKVLIVCCQHLPDVHLLLELIPDWHVEFLRETASSEDDQKIVY